MDQTEALKVGKLCITIPSQRDLKFEKQYRSILAGSFRYDVDTIKQRMVVMVITSQQVDENLAASTLIRSIFEFRQT